MTATGFAVALSLVLLPHGSMGATLTSEKDSVIRRVRLSPHGEMAPEQKHGHHTSPHSMVKDTPVQDTKLSAEEYAKLAQEECDVDFPLGVADTAPGNCTNANETGEISKTECIFAQQQSEAGAPTTLQISGERYENARPKGCFKYTCSESTKGVCYFYNGLGADVPDANLSKTKYSEDFGGTPVCKRPKYVLGTNDTNGEGSNCPGGYKAITGDDTTDQLQHENLCFLVANCLSDAAGDEFRIGENNASKHRDFPRGCFIDTDGLVGGGAGKVYFNAKTAEGFGTDGAVKGTPICKVNSYVKYDASGTAVDTEVTAAVTHNFHDKDRHDNGANDTKAVAAATAAAAATATPAPAASPAAAT